MIALEKALVVTGSDAPLLAYCVAQAQRARRGDGLPPSPALERLAAALAALGHADSQEVPEHQDGDMTTTFTAAEAAQVLGTSERTVRRLAPALGGRKRAGTWLFDAAAVHEHLEGTNP